MYSLRTTKIYSSQTQDINKLPLAQLGSEWLNILENHDTSLAEEKREYLEELKAKVDATFTGEESYEGDYSEYNLEEKVRKKFQDHNSLALAQSELVDKFASKWAPPKSNPVWLFGQMVARFATLPLKKNDNGLYSAKALYLEHILPNAFYVGMWLICRHPTRSAFLEKQTSPAVREYCSLVPLIMSAFKRFNNIPYTAWDPDEIFGITEGNLCKAMLSTVPDVTKEEVLEIRDIALTPKTGKTAGIVRNPLTTYSLYIPPLTPLTPLPALARIMVCQTWCAHPANRSKYMILNPSDWDDIPEPLVSTAVLETAGYTNAVAPW